MLPQNPEYNPAREAVNNDFYHTLGDRWYTAFDDPVALLRLESRAKVPWVLEKIKANGLAIPEIEILDVGCGAGFLSNHLAAEGCHRVHGLDLSEESLTVARKYDATQSVQYFHGNAEHLPFPDQSFDVITAMDFLEHIEEPEKVVQEIARVLRPGGLFFFHTFNRNPLAHLVIIKMVEWLVKNTPKNLHVINLFIKPKELAIFCERHGMRPKEWTGIRPKFSSITWQSIFTGIVPKDFQFTLTKSTLLSYMGYAKKR